MKMINEMKKFILILGSCFLMFGTLQAQNCARYVNGDSTKTTAPYSIYREFFKKQLYADALPYWRIIFNSAPGFRVQTMMDGEVMFTNLIQNTTDAAQKDKYADTLMMIYDKRIECHGLADYVLGKKAVDQLKYKGGSGIKDARANFEKSLQISGDNAYPFVIQTYFKLLINQIGRDDITADFVKGKYESLSKILDKNIAKNDKTTASNKEVKTLLDDLYTQNFADKSDPADCSKLLEIYTKKYNENPNDLETIKTVYNKTKGCADSTFNVELLKKLNAMEPSYSYAIRLGKIYTRLSKYDSAYVLYENAVVKETDSLKKADLYFSMANIKYEKNDFPASRDFAKQTIAYNPKMGTAYLLIGTLYAASGKLCGPGTGFQSQIILWPAFDYFKKAKEMDASVAEEAQKMLTTYKQYLPTKAEVTAKKLSVGGTYTVKCWINEETTVQVK
jgi:tetratricopeptide (TPR) repeat protein